ncbi:hypothetical protein CRI94_11115 [Longibacter salinarum]|uniref:Uncharacterized protein n=1 Tax=Longibacter salinarum TaxID=1850348 RepID=A0A2A8CX16_9BACT|nr:hypothetical protein CRI94_11115 [Longibacter salinarum]
MTTIRLPSDFREFLRLLSEHGVRYLVVGGYAVGYHGYPRTTGPAQFGSGPPVQEERPGDCRGVSQSGHAISSVLSSRGVARRCHGGDLSSSSS